VTEHNNIHATELVLMITKALPYKAFDPIALYRGSRAFSGDSHTQTRVIQAVGPCKNGHAATARLEGTSEDALELLRPGQSSITRKAHHACPARSLGTQARSAFGAPPAEDLPTSFGAHAGAKAMGTLAA
jgi:hypothetical protein